MGQDEASGGYQVMNTEEWMEKVTAVDGGQRLDTFWQGLLDGEGVARSRIQVWIKEGRATINGQVCTKPSVKILPGQTLTLAPDFPTSTLVPVAASLDVLYADESIAVINKEPGLTVHPAPSVTEATLVHQAAWHFPALLEQPGERPGIVHRLDKDTSGLIVLALSETARLNLTRAFAGRAVYKEYLAVVSGVPPAEGIVTLPLGRHPTVKTRMAVVESGGRPAETRYRLLWTSSDQSASLLRVRIMTGRTHQIRVHLAAIGHPLLGDEVYADRNTALRAPRQMLHAWQLRLEHPDSGEELAWVCPPPEDFCRALTSLWEQPLCIGLTGSAGSGKSMVLHAIQDLGVPVFSADQAVARAYLPGAAGCQILEHHFGQRFSLPQGGVDKAVLGQAMALSPSLRREVERLIHPLVRHELAAFRCQHPTGVVLAEIPLLCESGLHGDVDLIALVYCSDEVRHQRLRDRGWDSERIATVDSWQWPHAKKLGMAHLVLDNSGTLLQGQQRARAMIRQVRAMAEKRVRCGMEHLRHIFAHPDSDEMD